MHACVDQRFGKEEYIGRARARQGSCHIQIRFILHEYFLAQGTEDRTSHLCCSSVTSPEAHHTVIPSPICPGVLGIERTMALCFNPALSFLRVAPAIMDRTKAS